jgi:hypothetical protein
VRLDAGRRCAVLVAVVGAACGRAPGTDGTLARDSAGTVIVENGALGPEAVWQVGDTPVLDIGSLDGAAEYQLFRVSSALRLRDGRIAVANAGTSEIRLYDSAGRFIRSFGRAGEGPGEFRGMSAAWAVAGESLYVADRRLNRIEVFDTAGRFVRSAPFHAEAAGAVLQAYGVFNDGTLLVATSAVFGPTPVEPGVARDSSVYFRFSRQGELLDTLGTYPDFERFIKVQDNGFTVTGAPFARQGLRAVCGDGFYYGSSDRFEIRYYGADGSLRRLIRRAHRNLSVTPEDIDRYRAQRLDGQRSDSDRRAVERLLADLPFPATMPAYASIRCDDEGNLWVQEYRRPGDDEIRWSVFDPEGRLRGWVRTPDKLAVTHIATDFVLGVWRDDVDVEHVRLYALHRS